ncbi:hypothetical protein Mapa_000349 [Marchantia paleacea]|nr:hypothetical protein Mapa_000349 [Marchantia paleacea]
MLIQRSMNKRRRESKEQNSHVRRGNELQPIGVLARSQVGYNILQALAVEVRVDRASEFRNCHLVASIGGLTLLAVRRLVLAKLDQPRSEAPVGLRNVAEGRHGARHELVRQREDDKLGESLEVSV